MRIAAHRRRNCADIRTPMAARLAAMPSVNGMACVVLIATGGRPTMDTAWTGPTGGQPDPHAARLGALGAHVARVAHELNAPVSLIAGSLGNLDRQFEALLRFAETARPYLDRHPDLAEAYASGRIDYALENARTLLAICDEGVQRVGYVVGQLRAYARRQSGADEPAATVDLAAVLRSAARMAAEARPGSPAVAWDLAPTPPLSADAQALGQAFANLIGNAFDAVQHRPAPRVRVSALLLGPNRIEVRVRDNGPGVPPARRADIFEPFVSTKAPGVGLGLSIARDAIVRQGGSVYLAEGDGGADFVVQLPV